MGKNVVLGELEGGLVISNKNMIWKYAIWKFFGAIVKKQTEKSNAPPAVESIRHHVKLSLV